MVFKQLKGLQTVLSWEKGRGAGLGPRSARLGALRGGSSARGLLQEPGQAVGVPS